jgi:hypothetical protein
LIRAADSSPFALQNYLQRFRPSKATIALGRAPLSEETESQELDEEIGYPGITTSKLSLIADELRVIEESLDDLPIDSKLDALLKYIQDEQENHSHTLIGCQYTATVLYLKSALVELNREVFVVGAGSPAKEYLGVLSGFEGRGGILVTTNAAMQGVESSADQIIVYDANHGALQRTLKLATRPTASGKPVQIISLADD